MNNFSISAVDEMQQAGAGTREVSRVTEKYEELSRQFCLNYQKIFGDDNAMKTVVIIPSLSVDQQILARVHGSVYYEERLLCLLMLLRMPATNLIYVTSVPIDPVIVDYYLHLLPGITGYHARNRLTMLCCYDATPKPLTEKILERPRLMNRIRSSVPPGSFAHITCFNTTDCERILAVQLGMPIYGCNPSLLNHGSKSGSRKIFRECGISLPAGFEDLRDESDIAEAIAELKQRNPDLQSAMVKMNDGFAGEGNAIFSFMKFDSAGNLKAKIKTHLRNSLKIVDGNMDYDGFMQKFNSMHGIVEEYVEGEIKHSPSVQGRINPLGEVQVLSTHDQVLGGSFKQVFTGANFPANGEYAGEIGRAGYCIGKALKEKGVIGRFGIDFISIKQNDGWKHYAIEINLRKGGTSHPYLILQGLTIGKYDVESGIYHTANGQPRYYFCSDQVYNEAYRGLTSHDLIDIAMYNRLQYDGSLQEGVVFHLIGALSQFGKMGAVCIGSTIARANALYRLMLQVLNKEAKRFA
ncbi:MAG TPA: peptide ligase PGM1-related protein [Chitinophagales bacterium]|nr:peptide ligase PGM1-related protein [Chitinophagales bacterium]